MLSAALAAAGRDGIPLLLLLGPVDVTCEAVAILRQSLERDPMLGFAVPRIACRDGCCFARLSRHGVGAADWLPRKILADLPDAEILVELAAPCMLVGPDVLGNFGPLERQFDGIAAATRQDARQGEAQARKSGEALTGTAGAAARVAGEGAAHSREVNAAGALDGAASAGTLSNSGVPATASGPQHGAGANSVMRSVEPAPRTDTKSSGNSGNASHPSTEVTRPPSPGSSASASASADASLSASADR